MSTSKGEEQKSVGGPVPELQAYLQEQTALSRKICNAFATLQKKGQDKVSLAVLRGRMKRLESEWSRFRAIHARLCYLVPEAERTTRSYFKEQLFDTTEAAYDEVLDQMLEWKEELQPTATAHPGGTAAVSVKLPKFDLPKFSGEYLDWQSFRDVFVSTIHSNVSLAKVERFRYLKSSLTGEAESLLKNLALTAANYDSAWAALTNRYDNPRALVQAWLRTMIEIPPVANDPLKGLKTVRGTSTEVMSALANLDRPIGQREDLLIYLLVQKLDKRSRQEWETLLGDSSELPDYAKFSAFLETRIQTLDALASATKTSPPAAPGVKAKHA
jgi:hypothetical protein